MQETRLADWSRRTSFTAGTQTVVSCESELTFPVAGRVMAPGRRGRHSQYGDYHDDEDGGGGGAGIGGDGYMVPFFQRVLIYLIFFSIPGLLLFIVPTVRIGGGGGGAGRGTTVSNPPRHMGGHHAATHRTHAKSGLLWEDLTAGMGEVADDFVRSTEQAQAARGRTRDGGGGGGGSSAAGHTAGGGGSKGLAYGEGSLGYGIHARVHYAQTVNTGGEGGGGEAGGVGVGLDDGLGELADPGEDLTTPVPRTELSNKPDAATPASAVAATADKASMSSAARGWGAELGINSSFARSEKLYKLVRPHANWVPEAYPQP